MTEVEASQRCRVAISNSSRLASGAVYIFYKQTWGCTGFDAVIGKSGLRVRALFSVINERTKLNADNVIAVDFKAPRAAKIAA